MVTLADTIGKQPQPPYSYERRYFLEMGVPSPIMANIRSIAKAIPVIRKAAKKGLDQESIDQIDKMPNSAVQALAEKALVAEAKAANAYSSNGRH